MGSFLETAQLHQLADIRKSKSILPSERGIYGLFFRASPGRTPTDGCYTREGLLLLYIGTAGADLRKNGSLRKRLGNSHLGGNERRSTVCQTIAALLPDTAGPAVAKEERAKNGRDVIKFHTSKNGAMRLRQWMDQYIFVCWGEFSRPADFEEQLVQKYSPPLNIDFSTHPFRHELQVLREMRRQLAPEAFLNG